MQNKPPTFQETTAQIHWASSTTSSQQTNAFKQHRGTSSWIDTALSVSPLSIAQASDSFSFVTLRRFLMTSAEPIEHTYFIASEIFLLSLRDALNFAIPPELVWTGKKHSKNWQPCRPRYFPKATFAAEVYVVPNMWTSGSPPGTFRSMLAYLMAFALKPNM